MNTSSSLDPIRTRFWIRRESINRSTSKLWICEAFFKIKWVIWFHFRLHIHSSIFYTSRADGCGACVRCSLAFPILSLTACFVSVTRKVLEDPLAFVYLCVSVCIYPFIHPFIASTVQCKKLSTPTTNEKAKLDPYRIVQREHLQWNTCWSTPALMPSSSPSHLQTKRRAQVVTRRCAYIHEHFIHANAAWNVFCLRLKLQTQRSCYSIECIEFSLRLKLEQSAHTLYEAVFCFTHAKLWVSHFSNRSFASLERRTVPCCSREATVDNNNNKQHRIRLDFSPSVDHREC